MQPNPHNAHTLSAAVEASREAGRECCQALRLDSARVKRGLWDSGGQNERCCFWDAQRRARSRTAGLEGRVREPEGVGWPAALRQTRGGSCAVGECTTRARCPRAARTGRPARARAPPQPAQRPPPPWARVRVWGRWRRAPQLRVRPHERHLISGAHAAAGAQASKMAAPNNAFAQAPAVELSLDQTRGMSTVSTQPEGVAKPPPTTARSVGSFGARPFAQGSAAWRLIAYSRTRHRCVAPTSATVPTHDSARRNLPKVSGRNGCAFAGRPRAPSIGGVSSLCSGYGTLHPRPPGSGTRAEGRPASGHPCVPQPGTAVHVHSDTHAHGVVCGETEHASSNASPAFTARHPEQSSP